MEIIDEWFMLPTTQVKESIKLEITKFKTDRVTGLIYPAPWRIRDESTILKVDNT